MGGFKDAFLLVFAKSDHLADHVFVVEEAVDNTADVKANFEFRLAFRLLLWLYLHCNLFLTNSELT